MTTPKTGSPEWAGSQATPNVTMNEALRRIEAGASLYLVVDKDLATPPGSCADGATYIVGGGGGAWAGHIGDLAIAVGTNASSGWYFRDPEEGVFAWVQDEDLLYRCSTGTSPSAWVAYSQTHTHTASDVTDFTETAQDIVGAMVIAGSGISATYDDGAGTLTITNTGGGGGGGSTGGGATTKPQGRLTLTSLTPVMTADVTAASAVYYTPYEGEFIPIYESGSPLGWTMTEFSQLTLTLDTNSPSNHASGSVYDVFVWNDAGTVRIGTGPAWSSSTTRGTGAGTTELQMKDGIWTNANTINLINNTTTYSSIPQNEATYVGSIYCTANGQTGMAMAPAAAGGGANPFLAVWNAYNRVRTNSYTRDNTASWTKNSTTVGAMNAGASGSGLNNRVTYLDGLAQSSVEAYCQEVASGAGDIYAGMARDSTTAFDWSDQASAGSGSTRGVPVRGKWSPSLGLHYIQQLEATGANLTMFGAVATPTRQLNQLDVSLDM